MTQLQINNNTLLAVEVPGDAYDFEMRTNNEVVFLIKGCINPLTGSEKSEIITLPGKYSLLIKDYTILGRGKDLTGIEWNEIIEKVKHPLVTFWKNYMGGDDCNNPTESGLSFLKVNGISPDDLILIKK